MSTRKPMTAEELAEVIGATTNTVRRHCREGRIPTAEKHGPVWLIPMDAAERYAQTYVPWGRYQRPAGDPPRPAAPTTGKTAGEGKGTRNDE